MMNTCNAEIITYVMSEKELYEYERYIFRYNRRKKREIIKKVLSTLDLILLASLNIAFIAFITISIMNELTRPL